MLTGENKIKQATECHGFRLTERDDFFESSLDTFEMSVLFRSTSGSSETWLKSKSLPI